MIRVLLVDDNDLIRYGLALLLAAEPDIEVIGDAANGEAAVALAIVERPDVVLMDLSMPVLDGLAATRQILAVLPKTRVLVISGYADEEMVREAAAAGARGYLHKGATPAAVLDTVRALHLGQEIFGARIHPRR